MRGLECGDLGLEVVDLGGEIIESGLLKLDGFVSCRACISI